MSENQKQVIANVNEILYKLTESEISVVNSFFENMINIIDADNRGDVYKKYK